LADPVADTVVLGDPWVAIRDGKILAVGRRDDVVGFTDQSTETIDTNGGRVLPGLKDWHAHLVPTGLFRRRIDLHGLDVDGVADAVARRARKTPPGTWIRGVGFYLDALGHEAPLPASVLDAVAPDHPVRLSSHDLHAIWVNTRALREAGRPADSPAYLVEDEVRLFIEATGRESLNERAAAVRDTQRELHAKGITAIQEHGKLEDLEAIAAVGVAGELKLRIGFSVRGHEFEGWLESGPRESPFPGLLAINGLKMFLDGALGSRTAWLLDPYLDVPGHGHHALEHETALDLVTKAANAGYPTFFHAIGDAAVREALDLCAAAPGLPHRVEHAQLIHPDDLPRFAAQGVMASVQPVHLLTDTPTLIDAWGEERARRSFPVRTLLKSGAEVRFGSDTPVESFDPMLGIFAAAMRLTMNTELLPGFETIPVAKALELYFGAPRLKPGDPADLVVYSEDPATIPPPDLPGMEPLLTVFDGDVVFRR
jgi:predicted amidohydrolase YtcJ